LLGWTGEIRPQLRRAKDRHPEVATNRAVNGVANGQLDDIERSYRPTDMEMDEAAKELISLTKDDKAKYTQKVNQRNQPASGGKKYEMIPIWTLDDADDKGEKATAETPETQGRFRHYAEQGISSTHPM
jgi:hypothetical protein